MDTASITCKIYPIEYAHIFVLLCFVVIIWLGFGEFV